MAEIRYQITENGMTNLNFALMVSHLLHSHVFCNSSYKLFRNNKFKLPSRGIRTESYKNIIK